MDLLRAMVLAHICLWSAHVALDTAVIIAALKSNMFRRNRAMVGLMYCRIFFLAVLLGITVFSSYAIAQLQEDCFVAPHALFYHIRNIVIALFGLAWTSTILTLCLTACSFYLAAPAKRNRTSQDTWARRLRKVFCCYSDDNASGVYDSLAPVIAELFTNGDEDARMVPSDVAVGLLLVQAAQRQATKAGHQFFIADKRTRWDGTRARAAAAALATAYEDAPVDQEERRTLLQQQGSTAAGAGAAADALDGEGESALTRARRTMLRLITRTNRPIETLLPPPPPPPRTLATSPLPVATINAPESLAAGAAGGPAAGAGTTAESAAAALSSAAASASAAAAASAERGAGDGHEAQRAAGLREQAQRAAESAGDRERAAGAATRGRTGVVPLPASAESAAAESADAGAAKGDMTQSGNFDLPTVSGTGIDVAVPWRNSAVQADAAVAVTVDKASVGALAEPQSQAQTEA